MLYLKNVSYHPAATPHPIIEDINLTLAPQKLGLIVGVSGSGKTTLLEILAGLAERTSGDILWRTQSLTSEDLQQLCGIVFQFPERHFCGQNILEELRLGHPELSSDRIRETLAEVGLNHIHSYTPPHNLSGGQQRRLSLAVQLIRQPNLLLLDEPTAGLDWLMKEQLVNLLSRLKEHWTLLVVTHDPSDLIDIADDCWRLEGGKMSAIEPSLLQSKKSLKLNLDNCSIINN